MDKDTTDRPLALVTGATSGIGLELARQLAERGHDVVVAARSDRVDDPELLGDHGKPVLAVQADLATHVGVENLAEQVRSLGRPLDVLAINAGMALGHRFVDRPVEEHLELVDLNVRGSVHLAGLLLPHMAAQGRGHVLITSSIAAVSPGPYQATYNASKAFMLMFAEALREEMKDSGLTVMALMPGPTETEIFEKGDMDDTRLGQTSKDDPSEVAREALDALFAGKDQVVTGSIRNTVGALISKVVPERVSAVVHSKITEPGSGT